MPSHQDDRRHLISYWLASTHTKIHSVHYAGSAKNFSFFSKNQSLVHCTERKLMRHQINRKAFAHDRRKSYFFFTFFLCPSTLWFYAWVPLRLNNCFAIVTCCWAKECACKLLGHSKLCGSYPPTLQEKCSTQVSLLWFLRCSYVSFIFQIFSWGFRWSLCPVSIVIINTWLLFSVFFVNCVHPVSSA